MATFQAELGSPGICTLCSEKPAGSPAWKASTGRANKCQTKPSPWQLEDASQVFVMFCCHAGHGTENETQSSGLTPNDVDRSSSLISTTSLVSQTREETVVVNLFSSKILPIANTVGYQHSHHSLFVLPQRQHHLSIDIHFSYFLYA